jgi:hypothetical protein
MAVPAVKVKRAMRTFLAVLTMRERRAIVHQRVPATCPEATAAEVLRALGQHCPMDGQGHPRENGTSLLARLGLVQHGSRP